MIESLILHRLAEFGKSASPRTREQRFSLPRGPHHLPCPDRDARFQRPGLKQE